MRIFIAGVSGAIGRALIRPAISSGHQVWGMTHSSGGVEVVRTLGAQPLNADALDLSSVIAAVGSAAPDVIVHQLAALPKKMNPARFAREMSATNRLRTAGTDNLIEAARRAGVRRIVAQSFAGWPFAREGSSVKNETDPLDSSPRPLFGSRSSPRSDIWSRPSRGLRLWTAPSCDIGSCMVHPSERLSPDEARKFRQPLRYRRRLVVDDVRNAPRADLDSRESCGDDVVAVDERPDAPAAADNWDAPPANIGDHGSYSG